MRSILLLIAILIGSAATARADSIGVVVVGQPPFKATVAAELETWATAHGHVITPDVLDPKGLNLMIDCLAIEDHGCARKLFENRGRTESLVFARIDLIGTDEVTIHAYWIVKNQQVAATTRVCEKCTDESLRTTSTGIMTILAAAVGRAEAPPVSKPSRVLPVLLVIGGASALAAGGVELYLGTRNGADVKTIYPNAKPIGAALVGVGAVMVGVGVYLWTRGGRESAPVASVTADGGFVGWAGQF